MNQAPARKRAAPNRVLLALDSVGRGVAEMGWSLVLLAQMFGALTSAALGTVAHPTRPRLTSLVHHLERVGWRAGPIILLSTFMIGAILAQQGISVSAPSGWTSTSSTLKAAMLRCSSRRLASRC